MFVLNVCPKRFVHFWTFCGKQKSDFAFEDKEQIRTFLSLINDFKATRALEFVEKLLLDFEVIKAPIFCISQTRHKSKQEFYLLHTRLQLSLSDDIFVHGGVDLYNLCLIALGRDKVISFHI